MSDLDLAVGRRGNHAACQATPRIPRGVLPMAKSGSQDSEVDEKRKEGQKRESHARPVRLEPTLMHRRLVSARLALLQLVASGRARGCGVNCG